MQLGLSLNGAPASTNPTLDDVRAAFAELCRPDGGESSAAQVLARFRVVHIGDAPTDALDELLAALIAARRQG